ncbi:MAG TPA: hypothetical protein VGX50_04135 [Longimicrobium sp.]|nr:hypothetical protein [Longimicrobium sp.]
MLPLLFMVASLPIPPAGAEVVSLALLVACMLGSAAVVYGITRQRAFVRPLALLLGVYALVRLGAMLLRGDPAGPAQTLSMIVAGSVWILYVAAMLCFVSVPPGERAQR